MFLFGAEVHLDAAGISYHFFERLTLAFEATHIRYSQLVENFQVPLADSTAVLHRPPQGSDVEAEQSAPVASLGARDSLR